jgi:hypothetical protein
VQIPMALGSTYSNVGLLEFTVSNESIADANNRLRRLNLV